MSSNPSGAGYHGLELASNKPPIETLAEMKPATDGIEINESQGDESSARNQVGDVDRERGEEEIVNGDSEEKGDAMIGGEIVEKVGSFVSVEGKGKKEADEDSMENDQRSHYEFHLQVDKTGFTVDDLVWGKIKSHPWWPGQIFDPNYASQMALKRQKKDHFLVAYFGDKTFAWVPESQLKHFQAHFSAMEKQSGIEPIVNAVNGVLEEVSRWVALGMTCHCLADEVYADLKYKKVDNAGIREGTCSAAVDRSIFVDAFQPEALLEYIWALAACPFGGFDRLELTIATAQLKAFYCSKGHRDVGVFVFGGGLVENYADIPLSKSEIFGKGKADSSTAIASDIKSGKRLRGSLRKNRVTEDDNEHTEEANQLISSTPVALSIKSGKRPRGRPRKSSERMEEKDTDYFGNGVKGRSKGKIVARASVKKRKVVDSDLKRRKDKGVGKQVDSGIDAPSSARARSLKVGDCISRAASQLTESSAILKSDDKTLQDSVAKRNRRKGAYRSSKAAKENEVAAEDYSSPSKMLSQFCLAAKNPDVAYIFLPMLIGFFTKFRDSVSSNFCEDQELVKLMERKRGRKKKAANFDPPSSEISEPDYMRDTYWSDIVLDSEREPVAKGRKRKGSYQKKGQKKKTKTAGEPPTDVESPLAKQHGLLGGGLSDPNGKQEVRGRVISNVVETTKEETPTTLILSFNESDALPSVANLIKIFSPYGPLREEETEVLRKTNRAKVVFKYHLDAEKAYSSAGKYGVFGPALVSYRLRYLPSSKSSPTTSPQNENDSIPTKDDDLEHQEVTVTNDNT